MREDWEYKELGEVCDIYQPKTISNEMLVKGGKYPVYGANGTIGFYNRYNHTDSEILLTCRGATCGTINVSQPYSWINGNAMVIHRKSDYLDFKYLYFLMTSLDYSLIINGAAQPQITRVRLAPIQVAIPPKPTQLSIVSELDKLNELIQIKKEQLKDYDALAQSIFYEMFGDPVVNEKGWEVMSLGDICEITSSKRVFANEYVDMGVPFYRSKEVIEKSKQLPISVELYISESYYDKIKSSFGVPQIGDILVTAVGTIGKIWVVDTNEPFYFKDGNLVWLRKIKGVHSEYFRYSLFYLIDEYKKVNANGAAYNALTIAKLKLMLCPLPPLSLQQSFAHKIEQIERQKAAVQRTIKDLETLLAARMQYWFE